jgi:hypothetical protein
MRFANLILGLMGLSVAAAAGCGASNISGSTGGSSSSSSAASGNASSGAGTGACAPTSACQVADTTCLGLVDNTGKTKFGLRMSELDITAPSALASGTIPNIVATDVSLNEVACNLDGTGSFSWLLEFDTAAMTLKTGGATPTSSPTTGYTFESAMITQGMTTFNVAPITYTGVMPDATGKFTATDGQTLIVPIFLSGSASDVVLLPLQEARITMGTLSKSQNCIGSYNVKGLQVSNNCQPSPTPPVVTQFIDGASVNGFMTLEQADSVIIAALNESLCALLAGGSMATMYTSTPPGGADLLCTRDASNKIVFQGSWCAMTDAAATSTCADSVLLTANFAASSVTIND